MIYYTSLTPCPPQHAPCRTGEEPPEWQAWFASARRVRLDDHEVAAWPHPLYCYAFGVVVDRSRFAPPRPEIAACARAGMTPEQIAEWLVTTNTAPNDTTWTPAAIAAHLQL